MHEYKDRIRDGSRHDYEIVKVFHMQYDDFIWLSNHITDRNSDTACRGYNKVLPVSLICCDTADKMLLLVGNLVAVLYNAGPKVELRPNNHTARARRNAIAKKRRMNLKNQRY